VSLESWLAARDAERQGTGLTRRLQPRAQTQPSIDLAGNDYLGLRSDPRVVTAAVEAIRAWGTGAGASRLVTGTTTLHADLEWALATFMRRPSALAFSSGYLANLGAVTALSDPETLIVSDAHVHASLVDACRLARRSRVVVTAHNDIAAVGEALRGRTEPRAIVLCESVYSVLGDAAPLDRLVALTARHDAVLVVDEAHALGVAGPSGRGMLAGLGLDAGEASHVVSTVTLSKALGSQGGAVVATPAVVDHLVNTARTFVYDTGLAPASVAAARAALDVIRLEPERVRRLQQTAARLADAVGVPRPGGAVLSVPMPGPEAAVAAQQYLRTAGFVVGCFRPPSVPDGVSRLRLSANPDLASADLDRLVAALAGLAVR
jgi:8-amino-7-oxononanoate synthase